LKPLSVSDLRCTNLRISKLAARRRRQRGQADRCGESSVRANQRAASRPDAPQAGRSAAKPATGWSGQCRFGVLSQTMQLEVERRIQLLLGGCPQLGDLVLESCTRRRRRTTSKESVCRMRCPRNPARRVPCSDLSHHSVDARCVSRAGHRLIFVSERRGGRGAPGVTNRPKTGASDHEASVKSIHGRTSVTAGQHSPARF